MENVGTSRDPHGSSLGFALCWAVAEAVSSTDG